MRAFFCCPAVVLMLIFSCCNEPDDTSSYHASFDFSSSASAPVHVYIVSAGNFENASTLWGTWSSGGGSPEKVTLHVNQSLSSIKAGSVYSSSSICSFSYTDASSISWTGNFAGGFMLYIDAATESIVRGRFSGPVKNSSGTATLAEGEFVGCFQPKVGE